MMSILVFLILFLNRIDSSSLIVLRHVRLSTDNEQYYIRCPYNLNYLKLQLLNYSNENCFNLYSTSNNNECKNHYSPCQFQAKQIQLYCHRHSYSKYVDITYQCSDKYIKTKKNIDISPLTIHALSFPTNSSNPEESMVFFIIALGIVIVLWIFICCIWFIRYHNADENCQLISRRSYSIDGIVDYKDHSLIVDNLCLHINPFENNQISSLRTTQIV